MQFSNRTKQVIKSVFVLSTEPMRGLWFGPREEMSLDPIKHWELRGGAVCWEPFVPRNAGYWVKRIKSLARQANEARRTRAFLRLSKTSKTGCTWSLPAIAACPVRDETCVQCYALQRWYRSDLPRQLDRVLRLEYLRRLIEQDRLATWVDWMEKTLNKLPVQEPWPKQLRRQGVPEAFLRGAGVQYFRWHDSGDLFHKKYARAVLQVCEVTPSVAHWLPTRMGALIRSLVEDGLVIPKNLSVQVSVNRGGSLEQAQRQAVRDVLAIQPTARIGLSYYVIGSVSREVDVRQVEQQFGAGADICPAITAKKPDDRVCNGCRRCWNANMESLVVYPMI